MTADGKSPAGKGRRTTNTKSTTRRGGEGTGSEPAARQPNEPKKPDARPQRQPATPAPNAARSTPPANATASEDVARAKAAEKPAPTAETQGSKKQGEEKAPAAPSTAKAAAPKAGSGAPRAAKTSAAPPLDHQERSAAPATPAAKPKPVAPVPGSAAPVPPPEPAKPAPPPVAEWWEVQAVVNASHGDPFAFLGLHALGADGPMAIRVFHPEAEAVDVIEAASGKTVASLLKLDDAGFFAGYVEGRTGRFAYRLRLATGAGEVIVDDPYRFPPLLNDAEGRAFAEGTLLDGYRRLGAHPKIVDGVDGFAFTLWAPHASRVAVIGDFNQWDGRRHAMRRRHDCGMWEIFLPGVAPGALYKYEIKAHGGVRLPDKADPYAFAVETAPGSASAVHDLAAYEWRDKEWMAARAKTNAQDAPIAIYQVHLRSWRRSPEEGHRPLTYAEIADQLAYYVSDMGFTHVQLMPVGEIEDEASMGYKPVSLFAPSSRYGQPDDLRALVGGLHRAGIGVILDWDPVQFSDLPHGLRELDGTTLYEQPDPRHRYHSGLGALAYDYGKREVASFLISNALYWLDSFHVDGLRIGEMARMLYLDYGRARGEWTPNRHGGAENLEALEFITWLNREIDKSFPDAMMFADLSGPWAGVTQPVSDGGLGFDFRWCDGWVRDTERYLSRNPVHRKYYHDEITAYIGYAFSDRFVLPLSHEEVIHGRGALVQKMPGDRWQRFAHLRLYYALLYTQPGKKLLFMGDEFGQEREWNLAISLDWHVLDDPFNQGIQRLVRALNQFYRATPALHQRDSEPGGFEWIDINDADQSVISYLRRGKESAGAVVVVCNFTPVVRHDYRVGVPEPGFYEEGVNTDAQMFGGGNVGNFGGVDAEEVPAHGRPHSVVIKLPPYAAVILRHLSKRPPRPGTVPSASRKSTSA